jgi:RNA polymerase sigma-70 factor (ECF subfamily)
MDAITASTASSAAPGTPASSADGARAGLGNTSSHDDGLSAFLSVRPRLFGIAYRMLGSAAEAEDIVQDVWVRWQTADRSLVRDAAAFLVTTAKRLVINVMQSARSRRETYVGPRLPEPVDTGPNPRLGAERAQALAFGLLLLLEKLTPTERAAYILREAFDYRYREIANLLRLEAANARQVVRRARQHVANGRRMSANTTEQRRLLDAFIAAAHNGDLAELERALCVGCRDVSRQPTESTSPEQIWWSARLRAVGHALIPGGSPRSLARDESRRRTSLDRRKDRRHAPASTLGAGHSVRSMNVAAS